MPLIPKNSVPEQVEDENLGELVNQGSPEMPE